MQDILTVMWHEWRALFQARGGRSRFFMVLLSPLFMSVVVPWNLGREWLSSFLVTLISAVIAFLIAGTLIPDAFAGERERETLETLLATRLPDRAILLGKWLTAVLFALGVVVAMLGVSLVVANIRAWEGRVQWYAPTTGWGSLALATVVATLVGGLGIIISLHAATVQQAAVLLMAVLLVPAMALQAAALLMSDRLAKLLDVLQGKPVLPVVIGVLAVVDVATFALALARFRRAKLIAS